MLLPDLPPLQAELKKEAKTAKAELKAAKESHKALKGEQAALEAARAEVAALRVQQEARAADIAAAQAGLKVWGSVGGRGGEIQAAVRGGRVLGDSEGAWCEDFPTPHHAAMHLFPHIPPPPSPPSMQPAQADHVAKCAAVAKREAAAEKREAALEKREAAAERKEAAVAAAQAQVKEADAGIKADIKKLAAREKAAEEVCCEELAIMIKVWHSTRNLRRHTVLVFSYCFSILPFVESMPTLTLASIPLLLPPLQSAEAARKGEEALAAGQLRLDAAKQAAEAAQQQQLARGAALDARDKEAAARDKKVGQRSGMRVGGRVEGGGAVIYKALPGTRLRL